jgi:O-antigen ligase
LYGIAQYFGIDPFLDPELYTIRFLGSVVRPPSTIGHAIYFAAYLVPVALLAGFYSGTEEGKWKWVCGSVCALAIVAIVFSGSRGAVLALAAGGLMLATRPSLRLAVGGLVLLAVAATLLISPVRLQQWYRDPGGTRLGVWRDSPALILHHPLMGTGPETFAKEFRAVQSVELSRAYPDFYHETPHNAFIDAACAQGLPGAVILIAVFALGLSGPGSEMRGLRAALAGLLITSLFASLTLVTSMLIWTLAGLLSRPAPGRVPVPAIASIASLAFVAAAVVLGVQDRAYAVLQDDVDGRDFPAACKAFSVATSYPTGIPGYELWSSREFAALGRAAGKSPGIPEAWAKAAEAAALAEKQGEEPFNAAYQSAVLAVAMSDLTGAESAARRAIALAPTWYKPHLLLGQLLQAEGRNSEAADEIKVSRNLGWKGT